MLSPLIQYCTGTHHARCKNKPPPFQQLVSWYNRASLGIVIMSKHTHQDWHNDCKVTCSCGNSFAIGSVTETLQVDICDKCHPFFTGEVKFVDRQGRVDKFMQKMKAAQSNQTRKVKKTDDSAQENERKSYQQILREQRSSLQTEAPKE